MNPILTKKQNYALWQSGAFGNKLRAWRTWEAWKQDWNSGVCLGSSVSLRTIGVAGGRCRYDVSPGMLAFVIAQWMVDGVPEGDIMINESAPDDAVILQGEYDNELWGCFRYSTVQRKMRDALREASQETYGLRSDMLLRGAMTPSSYEDWRVLLDQYPKHVLEVSIYDRCLGDTPGRNALVWEVRRY